MPAVQRQTNLLNEIVLAFQGLGYALGKLFSAEPAPYWADYLRREREKNT